MGEWISGGTPVLTAVSDGGGGSLVGSLGSNDACVVYP